MKLKKKERFKSYALGGAAIGGIVQAGLGLGQVIYGGIQANKSKKEMARVRASAPSLDTPSEYMKLYKDSYNQDMLNRQMESLKSAAGSSIGALGQAGGRALLGGIQSVGQNLQQGTQAAIDKQQERQLAGLGALADARTRTQQMKEGRFQSELGMARQSQDAAVANIGAGIGAMGSGALYGFMGNDSGGGSNRGSDKGSNTSSGSSSKGSFEKTQGAFDDMEDLKRGMGSNKDGGIVKTKGKFSHKDNPIHMVQKGEKVGEMTGGEYIFNPEQMSKIKALSKTSPEKLSKYIKSLVNKFEKK
jgi:hypothetical protein